MTTALDSVEVVQAVARGIVELADAADPIRFSLPYPPSAQHALDLFANALARTGGEPPRSVPSIVRLCRTTPLREWGLPLPSDLSTSDELFVSERTTLPSQLCLAWAHDGTAGDERVRDLLQSLDEAAPDEETYEGCRALAISRPLVPGAEFWEANGGPARRSWRKIRDFYEPLPRMFVRDGSIGVCGSCSFPMIPVSQPNWECEWADCPRDQPSSIHFATGSVALPSVVRWALCAPGRTEAVVRRVSTIHGARTTYRRELPGALNIGWPSGEQWEVLTRSDVDPALLARSASRLPQQAGTDHRIVVTTGNRFAKTPGFRSIFKRNLAPESSGWSIVGADEFADLATRAGTTRPG